MKYPLEIITTEDRGRGVVYNGAEEVLPGTILFKTSPFVHFLQRNLAKSRCGSCLQRSEQLFKCGHCGEVRYCCLECQKLDWSIHKGECSDLKQFIKECNAQNLPLEDITDLVLLGRTLRKIEQQKVVSDNKNKEIVEKQNRFNTVEDVITPTSDDVQNLCIVPNLLKKKICVDLLINRKIVPRSTTRIEIDTYLRAFQCNNFAISDALMVPLAAGVYPIGSLLNHSCLPNCIVIYDAKTHVQVCRALLRIHPGEELCHLYTEAALPKLERQLTLHATYDFTCHCSKCGRVNDPLDQELRADVWGRLLPGIETINPEIIQHASSEETDKAPPLNELLSLLMKVNSDVRQAMLSLAAQEETSTLIQFIQELSEVLGPYNLDLYAKRCQAFSAALISNDCEHAISIGLQLVEFLDHVYQEIPYHPMLGLQLYTVGDLYYEMDNKIRAREIYERALNILRVAYGHDHEYCQMLNERLEEL